MKAKAWLLLLLAGWLAGISAAIAGNVSARALPLAEKLKEEAFYSVVSAQERVRGAQENLQLMRSVEREVAGSGDRVAIQTARQAVGEGEQGVREAQRLLYRAKALLTRREQQRHEVEMQVARERSSPVGLRGTMLALDGEVKVIDKNGRAVIEQFRPLQVGDRVVTGKDGQARLILAGGDAEALLGPGSDFRVTEDSLDGGFVGDLKTGYAAFIKKLQAKVRKKFEIHSTGTCSVRSTEFYIHALPEGMHVGVWEGVVAVTPDEPSATTVELRAGEQREWTRAAGWGPLQPLGSRQQRVQWGD